MITFTHGDLFTADVDAVVNTVNCVGIMGAGIALQCKKLYPDNYRAYRAACEAGEVQPGQMFVFKTLFEPMTRYIVNFPTKRHWRDRSLVKDIEDGLEDLTFWLVAHPDVRSIAIPALGCGNGGLNWSDVKPMIDEALISFKDMAITVFEPGQV